jgi:hypothetical protein
MPLEELLIVHRAYELMTTLYSARFQADGKPFVAHGVGVASILAELDQPAELLAAGLLHNVYGNGDFGDGNGSGATGARRLLLHRELGERVEQLVYRFGELRVQPLAANQAITRWQGADEIERGLILIDLVDVLEKYVDLGILYEHGRLRSELERSSQSMLEVARAVEPRLGEWLSAALRDAAAARSEVPVELHPADNRDYSTLLLPRSCRRRRVVLLRIAVRKLRDRTQLRTRLRRLGSPARRRRRAAT